MNERLKSFGCILLLGLSAILYFAPVVFSDSTFISRDLYNFFYPRRFFAAEAIRFGVLPFWNPYIACGVPFLANLQSAVFYPLSILYYVLPFEQGIKFFIIMHFFMGSLFMFWLMRTWDGTRSSALLAGLVFAYGGSLISIHDNLAFLTSGVWLPLVMLCYHRALKSRSFFYAVLTGIIIAIQVFAGDSTFCLFSSFVCTFFYTLLWPVPNKNIYSCTLGRRWTMLFTGWGLGFGLVAIQLLPFLEFTRLSTRFGGLSFEQVTKWSYHPLELLQLLVPFIFGTTVPATRWFGQLWLDTFYIGIFPLVFAVVFLAAGVNRLKYFLTALVVFSLFLSIGKYNPLFIYVYRFTPGIDMFQFPVKFLFIATFALAVMAGHGLDCFITVVRKQSSRQTILKALLILPLLLMVVLVAGAVWNEKLYEYFLKAYPATQYMWPLRKVVFLALFKGIAISTVLFFLVFIMAWAAGRFNIKRAYCLVVIFVIVFADLTMVGKPRDSIIDESLIRKRSPIVDFLQQDTSVFRIYSLSRIATKSSFMHLYNMPFDKIYNVISESLPVNLNMYHHISSIDEYSAVLRKDYYDVFLPIEAALSQERPSQSDIDYCKRIFDLLNVKYIISPYVINNFQFNLVKDGPIKIYENPTALLRAFFVRQVAVTKSTEDLLNMIHSEAFNPRDVVYIPEAEVFEVRSRLAALQEADTTEPFRWSVGWFDYQLNGLALRITTNKPGFLVLSNSYYPGWKAFVDGTEAPIIKVNHILQGVFIDAGKHEVAFSFQPKIFMLGLVVTLVLFVVSIVSLIILRKK